MRAPLTAFAIVAFVITGFALMFTNYNTTPGEQLNEVMAEKSIDDCYDATLTSWFIEFNTSQEQGATMSEADALASEVALDNYGECLAQR